jgi:hypothetical protein
MYRYNSMERLILLGSNALQRSERHWDTFPVVHFPPSGKLSHVRVYFFVREIAWFHAERVGGTSTAHGGRHVRHRAGLNRTGTPVPGKTTETCRQQKKKDTGTNGWDGFGGCTSPVVPDDEVEVEVKQA